MKGAELFWHQLGEGIERISRFGRGATSPCQILLSEVFSLKSNLAETSDLDDVFHGECTLSWVIGRKR